MKGLFGEVSANIKNSSKLILKVLSTTFFASLLISTVLVLKYPTFFKQKASNVNITPAEIQIAQMSAEEISKSVSSYNSEILMSEKQGKLDKNTVSKKDIQVDLKNKKDKSVERRKYMKDLIKKDTAKFLQNAVPNKVINKLDPKIKNNFEEEVTVEGNVENIIGENLETKVTAIETYINSKQGKLHVNSLDPKDKSITTGTKVKLNGYKLDKEIATESITNSKVKTKVKGATNTVVSGNKRLAVILFNFQDKTSDFWPIEDIKRWLFTDPASLNEYYKEVSFGNLSFSGDVFGPVTVPYNIQENCGTVYEPSMKAEEMIKASGVDLDSYDYIAFNFPAYSNCWAGAWANIGGRYTWFNNNLLMFSNIMPPRSSPNSSTTLAPYYAEITRVGLPIHEIGHNLGMWHANSYECKDSSGLPTSADLIKNCTSVEYGDPYDVMGTSYNDPRHVNNYHKGQMGWLPETSTLTTENSGDFKLYPIESKDFGNVLSANSYQAIRIPAGTYHGSEPIYYYLEYRKKINGTFDQFEANDPAVQGISLRLGVDYGIKDNSYLIDSTPERYTTIDSSIKPGQIFDDKIRGVKISTNGVDANGNLNVKIDRYTPECKRNMPDVYFDNPAIWGKPGETNTFNFSITNNDLPGCGATTFELTSGIPNGWTQVVDTPSLTINPQESKYYNISITSAGNSLPGTFIVSESIKHPAGNQYTITRSSVYNVYNSDNGGPVVNIINPVDGQTVQQSVLNVAANITDETQVTYAAVVVDDMNSLCDWSIPPYSCMYDFSNLSLGNHSLRFFAYDVFNNLTEKNIVINVVPKNSVTPSPTPTTIVKAGDVNRDGKVNIIDIGIVIDNYGVRPPPNPQADLNNDGVANIVDIGIIIDNYKI